MYIGAGLHFDPLNHFKDTKEFVFVDTQPRSEFDRPKTFNTCYYRSFFVTKLIYNLKLKGFALHSETKLDPTYYTTILSLGQRCWYFNRLDEMFPHIGPCLLIFFHETTSQVLKYYVSTHLEYNKNISYLRTDLGSCDGLVVSGHCPQVYLSSYVGQYRITMYGYSRTVFCHDGDEETFFDTHGYCLVDRIFLCSWETGELKECTDLEDLDFQALKHSKQLLGFGDNLSVENEQQACQEIAVKFFDSHVIEPFDSV